MKALLIKNNKYNKYKLFNYDGYIFKPKNKINNLIIVNKESIKYILCKKISNEIKSIERTIKLMLSSNITEISDCNMMINEINRVTNKLEKKYKKYFTEFEYFNCVKDLFFLNREILSKKKIIEDRL